jgi:hypothetical protein
MVLEIVLGWITLNVVLLLGWWVLTLRWRRTTDDGSADQPVGDPSRARALAKAGTTLSL